MSRRRKPLGGLGHYILDADGWTPILEEDYMAWARWFENVGEGRRVARTPIGNLGHISTVFLGLDHAFGGGRPVLFETLGFLGLDEDEFFGRYCTWDEAEAGHWARVAEALKLVEQTAVNVSEVLTQEPRDGTLHGAGDRRSRLPRP